METMPFLAAIREDLMTAATVDDEAAFQRLAQNLETSLQLRLFDVIGQVALELSDQLPSGHVEVRLAGRDVELVFVGDERDPSPSPEDERGTARLTLRMPEGLKSRVEQAAGREGVSTNAWLVRAVSRGLDHRRRNVGNRLTGFAQA